MNPIQFVFLAFLIIPFVEIYLLLQIGGIVGVLPTIVLVVSTAIIGVALLKRQGLATWQRFQSNMSQGQLPAIEIMEAVALLIGGALLLTPGFFTDIIGFACLIPAIRQKIVLAIIAKRGQTTGHTDNHHTTSTENIIEGEFKKED